MFERGDIIKEYQHNGNPRLVLMRDELDQFVLTIGLGKKHVTKISLTKRPSRYRVVGNMRDTDALYYLTLSDRAQELWDAWA